VQTAIKSLSKVNDEVVVRHHCVPSFQLKEFVNGKWLSLKAAKLLKKHRSKKSGEISQ